jgi:hypothetical protein
MKMILKSLGVGAAVVLAAAVSNATPITFDVTDPGAIGQNVNPQQPYDGTFDLTGAGYVPGTSTITSADFSFLFESDGGGFKKIEVGLVFNGTDLGNQIFDNKAVYEWDGTYAFSFQPAGGIVNYTISDIKPDNKFHNFKILTAGLMGSGDDGKPTPQVPDGGTTMMLLGMGCMLVGGLRRQLAK